MSLEQCSINCGHGRGFNCPQCWPTVPTYSSVGCQEEKGTELSQISDTKAKLKLAHDREVL